MSRGSDVCRRFVLHNDFIPPTREPHQWDYLAFGYYDGISVGKNIFGQEPWDLQKVREENHRIICGSEEAESRQIIYGFRTENSGDVRDEDFWAGRGRETDYPFLFFVMLQFENDGRQHLQELFRKKDEVEKKFTEKPKYQSMIYLTLENSDLFLIIRSAEYRDGAVLIDKIHRNDVFYKDDSYEWKVKYSFTVSAIDKKYLNETEKFPAWPEHMEHAHIYATERYSGSLNPFYEEICIKLKEDELEECPEDERKEYAEAELENKVKGFIVPKESVLGYNDELIQFRDMPWDRFLNLYKDKTGPLNHSSKAYQSYVSSLTTIIGLVQEKSGGNGKRPDDPPDDMQKLCGKLREKIEEIGNMKSECPVLHRNMVSSMRDLLNSLMKFKGSRINENKFFPTIFPISVLVFTLHELFGNDQIPGKKECYDGYCRFLSALNQYAQNSARSDRQFTQEMDYNVKIYNLPVKLNAFYSAVIFHVRELLNLPLGDEKKHQYEFLTCPGISSHMNVERLFDEWSEDKRLFLVNIPENQAYDLKLMMLMLCHEIAHFVGSGIRNRERRKEYLYHAFCRMITVYYIRHVPLREQLEKEYWEKFQDELEANVRELQEGFYTAADARKKSYKIPSDSEDTFNEEFKELQRMKERLKNHSQIVAEDLSDAMAFVIRERRELFCRAGAYRLYIEYYRQSKNKKQADDRKQEWEKQFHDCSGLLLQINPRRHGDVNIENMAVMLMEMCRECLSDMISIMILELSAQQYFEALIQNLDEQGRKELYEGKRINEVLVRAALVASCMIYKKSGREYGKGWEAGDIPQFKESQALRGFGESVNAFVNIYIWPREGSEDFQIKSADHGEALCDYFCDKEVLHCLLRYLLGSRELFAGRLREEHVQQEKIVKMYQAVQAETITEVMLPMQMFIDAYHNEIINRIEGLVNESGDL